MITTNNEELYHRLMALRTHGIYRNPTTFINSVQLAVGESTGKLDNYPGWYMELQELGFNYRLTDFQSALGISQLKRADKGLKRRKEIAKKYERSFRNKNWLKGQSGFDGSHAYHLYIIEVDKRLELYNYLRSKNIFCQVHYIPVHLMPYYRNQGFQPGDYPIAEKYYSRCLSLPMYPALSDKEQEYVISTIEKFYS